MATKILRLPEVLNRVGVRRATLYQWITAGKFPKQIQLGTRSVGWDEKSVESWLKDRISASQSADSKLTAGE
jgi:prophage regulatory protein